MPSTENRYAAIGYSVPASPSKFRVYVWRKLRQIGAENIKPGLAVLPENAESRDLLTSLAETVREMGGEASVYTLIFTDPAEETALVRLFAQRTKEALEKLQEQVGAATSAPNKGVNRRLMAQITKTIAHYEKIAVTPDPSIRQELEGTLRSVIDAMKGLPGMFSDELKDLLK